MSQLTNYGENILADYVRGQGMPLASSFSVALLTAASDSGYTEAAWTGYARQSVLRSSLSWAGTQGAGTTLASNGTSHTTSNNALIDFGTVGAGGSATVSHVGLFSGSDLFAYAELSAPLSVSDGDPVSLAPGAVVFTLGLTGGLSDYFSNKLIDLVWRGNAFVMPATMHTRLMVNNPTNAGGGLEVSGGAYARASIASSMAAWSGTQGAGTTTASTGTSGKISNNADVVFNAPTATWGTVTATAFNDAGTGGNLLFWAPLATSKTIGVGAIAPRFVDGKLSITWA